MRRNEHVVDCYRLAARSRQPEHVPIVDDPATRFRDEAHDEFLLAVPFDAAAELEPGTMIDTAAKAPAAAEPIAAVDGFETPGRRVARGHERSVVAAPNVVLRLGLEVSEHHRVNHVDRIDPGGRAVAAAQLDNDSSELLEVAFEPAVRGRLQDFEESQRLKVGHGFRRNRSAPIRLVASLRKCRRKLDGALYERVGSRVSTPGNVFAVEHLGTRRNSTFIVYAVCSRKRPTVSVNRVDCATLPRCALSSISSSAFGSASAMAWAACGGAPPSCRPATSSAGCPQAASALIWSRSWIALRSEER